MTLLGGFACSALATGSETSQSVEPSSATELNNRGVLEARAGRLEESAALLRLALARNPMDAVTCKNLSSVLTDLASRLEQQDKPDQALTVLQEAVEHYPDNGLALVKLGDLFYVKRSDLPTAIGY